MLHRFSEFKLEKLFESLILESKLEFSDKFKRVLGFIPDTDKIKQALLINKKHGWDIPITKNYIDVTYNKEEVTFIQDRRAQQLIRDNPPVWKTNSSLPGSKFLTFNKNNEGEYKNKKIFDALGFEPTYF